MVARIKDWSEAPVAATHRHRQTGMWYNIQNGVVRVFGGNNKWNNSKVLATSEMLEARPVETKETTEMNKPEIQVITASSLEDAIRQLKAAGIPAEVIESMLGVELSTPAPEEEVCNCAECTGCDEDMSRAEVGAIVGNKLGELLHKIKRELELDFDVQDIMAQIGFVNTNAKPKEPDFDRLALVVEDIQKQTGMPMEVAIAGLKQCYDALDKHGFIKH